MGFDKQTVLNLSAIRVSDLIRHHRMFQNSTKLSVRFGDGFCYAHNVLFKRIRDQAVKFGIQFKTHDIALEHCCPPLARRLAIKTRALGVYHTAGIVREIARSEQGFLSALDFTQRGIRFDFLLHDSAFLLAHAELSKELGSSLDPKMSQASRSFVMALSTAFALSVDALSVSIAKTEIENFMLSLNIGEFFETRDRKAIYRITKKFGFETSFRSLIAAYYAAITGGSAKPRVRLEKILIAFSDYESDIKFSSRDVEDLQRISTNRPQELILMTSDYHILFLNPEINLTQAMNLPHLRLLKKYRQPIDQALKRYLEPLSEGSHGG